MREFSALFRAEMLNCFGKNVYRHTKDPADRKRRKMLRVTVIVLLALAAGYIGGASYALAGFGAARYIPMLYSVSAAAIVLLFGLITVRGNLYREKDRELLAAMPVRGLPIAAARIARLYLYGVFIAALVLVPAYGVYFAFERPGAISYLCALPVILTVPVLPVVLTVWIGIAVTAILARMRHKVLAEVAIAILVVVGMLVLPVILSGGKMSSLPFADMTEAGAKTRAEMNEAMAKAVSEAMQKTESSIPALKTWGGIARGNLAGLLLFGLGSVAMLSLTVLAVGFRFFAITAKLAPTAVHREYRMERLASRSSMTALVSKEAKRYFSCGIYVSNTIIGAVLTVALAVAFGFFEPAKLVEKVGKLPVELHPESAVPFLFGIVISTMSITSSAVSMEGKNWWIVKSLPVRERDIINAKLLFSLLVWAPFYLATEIILWFTLGAGFAGRLLLLAAPAAYIVFSSVWGLFCNLHFPKFRWETPTEVVKQSAAVGLTMLGAVAAVIPAAAMCIVPKAYAHITGFAVLTLLLVAAWLLHRKNLGTALTDMN